MNRAKWGIGVDIEEVGRIRAALLSSERFAVRTFSSLEIEYCAAKGDPAVHFAGIFAAKEASCKAASHILEQRMTIDRFEIRHDERGMPVVRTLGASRGLGPIEIKVSISHTAEFALAVALAT